MSRRDHGALLRPGGGVDGRLSRWPSRADALVLGLNQGLGPDDAGLVRLIVERKAM